MPVKYLDWITREHLRASPEARFVFGDNRERWGMGGQAGAMRGEPNAIGVATLYAPGEFYRPDDPLALATVASDLFRVAQALAEGRAVSFRHVIGAVPRAGREPPASLAAEAGRMRLSAADGATRDIPFDGAFLRIGRTVAP